MLDDRSEEFLQLLRNAGDGAGQLAALNASVATATEKAAEAETARLAAVAAQEASEGAATTSNGSATAAQLRVWEAEASELTANSYAVEPKDTTVKFYTSNDDGTFTQAATTDYSALHYMETTLAEWSLLMKSDPTGITGATQITNTISISSADYAAIVTKDPATQYIIV